MMDYEAAVLEIFREWESRAPRRTCAGLADCCRFRLTGETPHVTLGEARLVARAWKAAGRTSVAATADGACPFLSGEGRCMVYGSRPFACRTHFCVAEGGAVPRREVRDLIQRLDDLDQRNGGDGARLLPEAVKSVLAGSRSRENRGAGKSGRRKKSQP